MHNTLMFISSDIIAVSVSARTSAGIISGLFPCDVLGVVLSAGMISGYVLGLLQAFPVVSVGVPGLLFLPFL